MDILLWNYYTQVASRYGWKKTGNTGVRYKKGNSYVTIEELKSPYVRVTTTINHPTQGRTSLVRILYWNKVGWVFSNPRVHTGYGIKKERHA